VKVLFLDIDGVVNKKNNFNPSSKMGLYPIDAYCAFLVGRIQLATGCQVVLSSSWRHHPDGVKNVSERVVELLDVTPVLDSGHRGDEVNAWLKAHPECTDYAILDDDIDFHNDQHLFKTTFEEGLTDEIANRVIAYFNRESVAK
jgi:hypothetical protein